MPIDTRANLRREMEERKKRYEDKDEVRARTAEVVKKLGAGGTFFDGTHIFTPHSDVPDDGALRLVVLLPEQFYSREEPRLAFDGVLDYVRNNGTKPRYRGNRLIFVAADHGALARLSDCIRVALAWNSIVEDVAAMRLVLDNLQAEQAKKELKGAEDLLPRVVRECYKWLLCPSQHNPTGKPIVETFPLNTSGAALGPEIERVCLDNELVIATWSPIHLRTKLKELYWKADKPAVKAVDFWEDTLRYLYLPRLKDRGVLAQAVVKGAGTRDFFGTAYGQSGDTHEGFKFGDSNVQFDDTLLLIDPEKTHRKWRFKHAPVTCSDTLLLTSPRICEIVAAFFSGENDVPHPHAHRCLFFWACRRVSAGARQMPRLASLRIPGKQDLNFAILSKNWGLSQKTKRPFVAIKTRTRESTSRDGT